MHLSRLRTDSPAQRENEGGRDDKVAQLSKGVRFLGKLDRSCTVVSEANCCGEEVNI